VTVVAAVLALQALPSLAAGPAVGTSVVQTATLAAQQVLSLGSDRLVGVTWTTGTPTVTYRWHSRSGWSAWETAESDSAQEPQARPGTEPLWRPAGADRVELRTTGASAGLQVVRVADKVVHQLFSATKAEAATGRDLLGPVHSRAEWGADESLRRAPSYAPRVDAVVVHHTVNANGYSREDVPSLIRADYLYHVKTRGWDDLGYNLLVDQYGRVWEGRAGGLGRATIGSHAQGFNDGTLGVAMIGDMTKTTASRDAQKALARVIAYAARTWGFDPHGTVVLTSKGSPRYRSGLHVRLPRVYGHQQTGRTACPGSLQQDLPALRDLAVLAARPAPKLVGTALSGAPVHAPTAMSLTARLTEPAGWTATLTSPTGDVVARATGSGTAPKVTWDGTTDGLPAAPGTYAWRLTGDDTFHDPAGATGTFDVGLPFVNI
jgi:hypothetical protein